MKQFYSKNFLLRALMSLVVMVTAVGAWADRYELVTSADGLVAGAKYIMVSGTSGDVYVVSTESNNNNRRTTTATVVNSAITSTDAMMVFELGGSENAWTFTTTNYAGTDGSLYNNDTGNNRLYVGNNTATNKFTITFSNNEISSITCNGNTSKGVMCFNGTLVACYASKSTTYKVPQLYKKNENYMPVPYTVTFNAGKGSCTTSSITESAAKAGVSLPTCTPPEGYTFEGWSLQEGGSILSVKSGETYSPSADCTLYAIYKKITNKLEVVYNFNDKNAYPTEFPAGGTATAARLTTKISGNNLVINAPNSYYIINSGTDASRGLFFGKTTAENNRPKEGTAYLEFPAKVNCKLVQVLVTTTKGVAGSVKLNIYTSDWKSMSTESTTVNGVMSDFTFDLNDSQIETPYRLASGSSGKNLQFDNIILVYEKVDQVTLPISSVGYSTYYNSLSAYTMPEGCEGLTAKYENGTLALNSVYKAGDVVPAGEPLIIRAAQNTYTLNFVASNAQPSTDNDLLGTDEATELEADDTSYFYALSLNKNSEANSVGFYWMNGTGAAFKNGAHKAYLKLAKASEIKQFVFADDATAISTVSNAADDVEAICSVSGARQNTMKKGINIVKVGGQVKKVYVK